jgi:transposase
MGWYDRKVRRLRDLSCGDTRIFLELEVRRLDCRRCGKVKRERLDFLADNPLYTKRFAYYVGRRCRSATIKDVASELKLDWHTGQDARPAVHGGPAQACRHAFTASDWH